MNYRTSIQAMHRVSHRVNRITARAGEVTDRVSGQVSERMGQVGERMHHATQRAVLPITVTCTVALSSGAMGHTIESSGGTRSSGPGSTRVAALSARTRERMDRPSRPARPQHRSARPRSRSVARPTRSQRAPLADVRRVGKSNRPETVTGSPIRKARPKRRLGVRERFALWRLQELARRSGDVPDSRAVEKALSVLENLERVGVSGAYRRWRASMGRRKGFRTAAIVAAGRGDFEAARDALSRARAVDAGPGGPLLVSSGRSALAAEIYDRAMRLAGRFAERGRPDLVQEAIDFAAEVAIENQLSRRAARHERRSARLLRAANRRLIQALLRRARQSYRAGRSGDAWSALIEAREVKLAWDQELFELAEELETELVESCEPCSIVSLPWDASCERDGAGAGAPDRQRARGGRRLSPVFRGAGRSIRPGASAAGSSQSRGTTSSSPSGRSTSVPTVYQR